MANYFLIRDLTLLTHRSIKFRLRFESLEPLCIDTLSMLSKLSDFTLSNLTTSSVCLLLKSLSKSSQLFVVWDGVCSVIVAFEAALGGSASRRPSKLRDLFGMGGLPAIARDDTGVFEPLRV
jgi:hypothetical protein